MNNKVYSKGYEDNREFPVGFDGESQFGLIKHLYYEFPMPIKSQPTIVGNFVFSRIDFNLIYHYLKTNEYLSDRLHDLLVDGERLFEDDRSETVLPSFNIVTRDNALLSIESEELHNDILSFEAGLAGIVGVSLQGVPVGSIEIHKPYTFKAKNILFMAEFIEGSPSFGVF